MPKPASPDSMEKNVNHRQKRSMEEDDSLPDEMIPLPEKSRTGGSGRGGGKQTRVGAGNDDESNLKNALELRFGVNYISLAKTESPDQECQSLLSEHFMRQHEAVVISNKDHKVSIAMVNPNNLVSLDEIKARLKNMQIKLFVCSKDAFDLFMERIFS